MATQLKGFGVRDSFLLVEKVTVLFLSAYTPEGREKYVLALHECVSSTSLSMAFTACSSAKKLIGVPQCCTTCMKC